MVGEEEETGNITDLVKGLVLEHSMPEIINASIINNFVTHDDSINNKKFLKRISQGLEQDSVSRMFASYANDTGLNPVSHIK